MTVAGRSAIALRALGATLLALFIWDYISVQRPGLSLRYRVQAAQGYGGGGAVVSVHWPDTQTFFNGDQGYAWEIRPISISESQAVIDFRVEHFNYFAPASEIRAQLKQSGFRRLILRPEQPLNIDAPDGAKVSLSGSIY